MESMACGCALCATDYLGVHEFAVAEENALLSPAKDVEAMVRNASRLLEDDELRSKVAEKGMDSVKKLDWNNSVDQFAKKAQIISIIIPIYNVAPYLERCVESLVNQSYPDMEIILIDDGSTDDSGKIADRLAEVHENVLVIHQENRGVSAARNAGLREAQGDYIGFVDPDDYVDEEMYLSLYAMLHENSVDVAACTFLNEYEDGRPCTRTEGIEAVMSGEEAVFYDLLHGMFITCNKLFSRKACYNIFYDEESINGEDRLFDVQALLQAERVVYVNKPFYHYCHRPNSAGTKKYTHKDGSLLEVCRKISSLVGSRKQRLKDVSDLQLISAYMQLIEMMECDLDKYSPDGTLYLKELRKNIVCGLTNTYATTRFRIRLVMMCVSPKMFNGLRLIYRKVRGV